MQRRQNPPSFERGDAAKIAGKIRKISKQFWQVTAIPQFQNTRVQYIILKKMNFGDGVYRKYVCYSL